MRPHNRNCTLQGAVAIFCTAVIRDLKNPYIYADELHTNQIMINLISNAIKYSNPGCTVEYCIEQISEPENGIARYRLTVKDNGIGMSDEFQKHLFESFSREKDHAVSREEGVGLGLAIVKKYLISWAAQLLFRVKRMKGQHLPLSCRFA